MALGPHGSRGTEVVYFKIHKLNNKCDKVADQTVTVAKDDIKRYNSYIYICALPAL